MAFTSRQILFTCLLLAVIVHGTSGAVRRRRPVIPGKTQPQATEAPLEQTKNQPNQGINSNALADMERRMVNVELSTSAIKSEMRETKLENTRLKEEMQRMGVVVEQLDEANRRVTELERILSKFENFFGVLYTDLPDVFAREISVTERLSALGEYIGNREAELMALRPNLPFVTADPADNPLDEELLGVVVDELSTNNAKLRRRLDDMENRMVSLPSSSDGTNNNPSGVVPAPPDEETQERLTRLERLVALQLAPQLDDDTDDDSPDLGVNKRLSSGGARVALSESDTEILRSELDSVRSISSTRKSVFSAASTRHLYGESGVHKPVLFDHIFSNKGNHFQEGNSTFICGITGFYFITFTTRSYDNRYLGVSLLKNGERVTSVSGERDPEKNQMMTQSVVLHLSPGDKLWLTVAPADSYAIYSDQSKYCTFSGFLLFKGS